MVYEAFVQEVRDSLQNYLGDDVSIGIQRIPKNNGLTKTALCLLKKGSNVSPSIYMEPYYSRYMNQERLPDIVAEIAVAYQTLPEPELSLLPDMTNFSSIEDKIIFHLIHASSNLKILSDVPFIPWMDLAIVFYIIIDAREETNLQCLIHNEYLKSWNIDLNGLMECAKKNTPRLFPCVIRPLRDVMEEMLGDYPWNIWPEHEDDPEVALSDVLDEMDTRLPLHVLTNQRCRNGACCILYDQVLKNFADDLGQDLVILPSSVHEVLIVPVGPDSTNYDSLSEMVTEINASEVPPEDRLSNQVYLYDRSDDSVRIVSCSPEYFEEQ